MSRIPKHREIIKNWLDLVGQSDEKHKPTISYDLAEVAKADEVYEQQNDHHSSLASKPDFARFQSVQDQKEAIVERLERDDQINARRFTQELIQEQTSAKDNEFAAKTLCALAQDAKRLGHTSLQLEWIIEATRVNASDPWPFAQAADAFLSLYRYDEANQFFEKASSLGDEHYGSLGKARVLLATGRFDEAYFLFKETDDKFPRHQDSYQAWLGMSDAKRGAGDLDSALSLIERASKKYNQHEDVFYQKALILRVLGRLDEAIGVYNFIEANFGETLKVLNGRALIYRTFGKFASAIELYNKGLESSPNELFLLVGRAETLRESGDLERALHEFEQLKLRFDHEPRVFAGLSQTFRDLKNYPEALRTLAKAVETFPYEAYLRNAQASVFKQMGKLEQSLATYDETSQAFPYNLGAQLGRVQLLKEFERLDLAADAVEVIDRRFPSSIRAKNAKASILMLQGKYDEALQLLSTSTPRTFDDWKSHYIRSMIKLRLGNVEEASIELKYGLDNTPFARTRVYYSTALAAIKLRQEDYIEARSELNFGSGATVDLLVMQCEAAVGNTTPALTKLNILRSDPRDNVVYLAEEIARQYGLLDVRPNHDKPWLTDRSTDIIVALAA